MAKIKIPKGLPDCELLRVLATKADKRVDIDFDFLGTLERFRKRVGGEVRQINELFREYTPHDEQHHLKPLFYVADTVLGVNRLKAMNSAELFVLAVALYGHDWGMAVSQPEKQYILTGKPPEGEKGQDLWVLRNEQDRFSKFASEQRLPTDSDGGFKEIPTEVWREYVRQTHAFRSSERVRRFFEPIDGGVAEAASRVCVGHWLDFEDLQDYRLYPRDFAVLRETANLSALAVYLRLIDLLDLAQNRTPYVIWKFVAPRDPHSRMEWKKHRALQPVTCPPYLEGRIIRVDGSTDDHEVYAALEDLRIWCEQQLRGCKNVLARMNDPRHQLDLYDIHWRVAPLGFKPLSIRFEFDRDEMFEILGEEIYQGDPYVFLRELLQNSIDAIRMRREVLLSKGISPANVGVIRVTVDHGDHGDVEITWSDDGIGMDEHIVRNYLAVAGKSYYRSYDFQREGLEMDPISRFGIGILSCFMVAERVEVDTFKDPYLPPRGEPLRIEIPAMRRQFRIEARPEEAANVGTTVRVFVEGKKLPKDADNEAVKPLDVTAYLSIVAGFVVFPIVITEGDHKTIILHPHQDAEAVRERFGQEFEVHQVDLNYPWSEAILPQDLATAREFLQEECWDIGSDLGLEGYDGILTCLVPADKTIDVGPRFTFSDVGHTRIIVRGESETRWTKQVRWYAEPRDERTRYIGLSRSGSHASSFAVYRDGVLVPMASPPAAWSQWYDSPLPPPRLVVNLPKSTAGAVDLARTAFVRQREHWDTRLFQAHLEHVFETSLKHVVTLDPTQRLYELARVITFHNIPTEALQQVVCHDRWPMAFLEPQGRLRALEWQKVAGDMIYSAPSPLKQELAEMVRCQWLTQTDYAGPLIQWAGDPCIAHVSWVGAGTETLIRASELFSYAAPQSHVVVGVRFLVPPWEGDPPLLQHVWAPRKICEGHTRIERVIEKAVENPAMLNPTESAELRHELLLAGLFQLRGFWEFPKPFEGYFGYGAQALNLNHPATQALLSLAAAIRLSRGRKSLSASQLGRLEDALNNVLRSLAVAVHRPDEWAQALQQLWSQAQENEMLAANDMKDLTLRRVEFVPGSTELSVREQDLRQIVSGRPFGQPLT